MIHISSVRKFMHNNIIHQLLGHIIQLVVEIHIAFRTTAPPPCFLVTDSYSSNAHIHYITVKLYSLFKCILYIIKLLLRQTFYPGAPVPCLLSDFCLTKSSFCLIQSSCSSINLLISVEDIRNGVLTITFPSA